MSSNNCPVKSLRLMNILISKQHRDSQLVILITKVARTFFLRVLCKAMNKNDKNLMKENNRNYQRF